MGNEVNRRVSSTKMEKEKSVLRICRFCFQNAQNHWNPSSSLRASVARPNNGFQLFGNRDKMENEVNQRVSSTKMEKEKSTLRIGRFCFQNAQNHWNRPSSLRAIVAHPNNDSPYIFRKNERFRWISPGPV